MRLVLEQADLITYLTRQLDAFFPVGTQAQTKAAITHILGPALERLAPCIAAWPGRRPAEPAFDPLHTDQYAAFLYLASRVAFERGEPALPARLYALNKALHGLDAFYEVALPRIFAFQHPVGTVLGRATYADYFFVYQNCTVGSNLDDEKPVFMPGTVLYGHSRVIGRSRLGPNSWISNGACLIDAEIPGDCVVRGLSPDATWKPTRRNVMRDLFHVREAVS